MGRKAYSEDLAEAKAGHIPRISNVRSGEDGEFTFCFHTPSHGRDIHITALVSDVSAYPDGHNYLVFANDDTPLAVSNAIEHVSGTVTATTIPAFLSVVSTRIRLALADASQHNPLSIDDPNEREDTPMSDAPGYDSIGDESDGYDDQLEVDNEDWGFDDDDDDLTFSRTPTLIEKPSAKDSTSSYDAASFDKMRKDLLTTKAKGFKVGVLGSPEAGNACYINVSCRVSKLGISEEAMQAWSLSSSDYLILLMYFPVGYRTFESLSEARFARSASLVHFRVVLSDHYKARSTSEASALFSQSQDQSTLRDTFISRPLNALFNERFLQILAFRQSQGLLWSGAEMFYNDSIGSAGLAPCPSAEYFLDDDMSPSGGLMGGLVEDAVPASLRLPEFCLPLIAMQFLLRHFVGCTNFCLVCHCKTDSQLEAIKPYVCSKPLCLYQYMNLGLGPSIDHEVRSQPLVVDLLISFCYSATHHRKMRAYPLLDWKVPHPDTYTSSVASTLEYTAASSPASMLRIDPNAAPAFQREQARSGKQHKASFNPSSQELTVHDSGVCPVNVGDWIMIKRKKGFLTSPHHYRVMDTAYRPLIALSKTPITPTERDASGMVTSQDVDKETSLSQRPEEVTFCVYDTSFETLDNDSKSSAICMLLDTMPSVGEMQSYLSGGSGRELEKWNDRLSPAHAGLLRWIVASNRSCILQIDDMPRVPETLGSDNLKLGVRSSEERVKGMDEWLQFRFAMGSPDKEARFIQSLKNGDQTHPSLFAWHGSPFHNWHSIVREGLNYEQTAHGRAYGHGVYHALDFSVSTSYTTIGATSNRASWPNSVLSVSSAIVLSEIVNAPQHFVSSSPYYVVQHIDWIQTRYLFAKPASAVHVAVPSGNSRSDVLPQDPRSIPRGPDNQPMSLPISALPKSRRPRPSTGLTIRLPAPTPSKGKVSKRSWLGGKSKTVKGNTFKTPILLDSIEGGSADNPIAVDSSDTLSVTTLDEDLEVLGQLAIERPARQPTPPAMPVTAFTPSSVSSLPTMPPPAYATRQATMALQKAYRTLLATQEEHIGRGKLAELGWYMDVEHTDRTDNLYQWVVCMHSFPLELPLAKDMQEHGVESIVFELRFPHNFPFSPPFIRVVRPRFLPFHMGGGGHVTAGGSICMDLLTSSGWNVASSIESVLLNIRMAIMSTDPRPARLEEAATGTSKSQKGGKVAEYGVQEAVSAFMRACQAHGWKVPEELMEMTKLGR